MESVGRKIRDLRNSRNESLKRMGEKIGYNWSNLSKVERGVYNATLDLVKKIIEVYDLDPTYFFGEGFTSAEGDLLLEQDLGTSALKEKYEFTIDGVSATDEEIAEAIRLIRYLRDKGN